MSSEYQYYNPKLGHLQFKIIVFFFKVCKLLDSDALTHLTEMLNIFEPRQSGQVWFNHIVLP